MKNSGDTYIYIYIVNHSDTMKRNNENQYFQLTTFSQHFSALSSNKIP